uniref:ditrans,polycis-polyprenyl diphosphate synthase [(2E,6E)-farnesyldiphosphate specific] n=1 Tax=Sphaeramia orbicularis TaxID=375764 RepID=A0A672ZA62_9TELE
MALLYGLLWRLLLLLVHVNRTVVCWLRVRARSFQGRLWERAVAALLLPVALIGFPGQQKKLNRNPDGTVYPVPGARAAAAGRRSRWVCDGRSVEKLPVHIGLLVAEEEPDYTDIANLVVWCMAVGISYVSVYDDNGIFQKNNCRLLEEIVRQQQDLLGTEGSKYNVETSDPVGSLLTWLGLYTGKNMDVNPENPPNDICTCVTRKDAHDVFNLIIIFRLPHFAAAGVHVVT